MRPRRARRWTTCCAIVDLPAPERPVNHKTAGSGSARVSRLNDEWSSGSASRMMPPPLMSKLSTITKRPVGGHSSIRSNASGVFRTSVHSATSFRPTSGAVSLADSSAPSMTR